MALYKGNINAKGMPLLRLLTVMKGRKSITHVTALIDTGATRTSIGQGFVEKLGLNPDGVETIITALGSANSVIYNDIKIVFPDDFSIKVDVGCTGSYYGLNSEFNIALGMDVLKHFTLLMNGPKKGQYMLFDNDYKLKFT